MKPSDFNRDAWDRIGRAGDQWFFGATDEEMQRAIEGDWQIKITPTKNVPESWMVPLSGRDVLLLAGGGGQQAPIISAAGARVTVVDISQAQLDRDIKIAKRHGLKITTVCSDIGDMRSIGDQSFDLIINPTSVCYCEQLQPIWNEAYRVLRPEGRFVAGFMTPVNYLFDAIQRDRNLLTVRHAIRPAAPYRDNDLSAEELEMLISPERPFEYGHSLTDLIGGQLIAGFQLVDFYTDRWGDKDCLSNYIDVFAATCSKKPA